MALFVALGGASYAAIKIPKNSVGSAQIKKNAVTSAKVKDRSLLATDFKSGQLPAGAAGQTGAVGAVGPAGAVGAVGPAGAVGAVGAAGVGSALGFGGSPGTTIDTSHFVYAVQQNFTVPHAGLVTFAYSGRFIGSTAGNSSFNCLVKGTGGVGAGATFYSSDVANTRNTQMAVVGSFTAATGVNTIYLDCIADVGSVSAAGWDLNVYLPGA